MVKGRCSEKQELLIKYMNEVSKLEKANKTISALIDVNDGLYKSLYKAVIENTIYNLESVSTKDLVEELNKRKDYDAAKANINELKKENEKLIKHNHLLVETLNEYMDRCSKLSQKNFDLIEKLFKSNN